MFVDLIVSSATFGGFTRSVDPSAFTTNDELCCFVTRALDRVLDNEKLFELRVQLNKTKFHIHDTPFKTIKNAEHGQMFYICDHC